MHHLYHQADVQGNNNQEEHLEGKSQVSPSKRDDQWSSLCRPGRPVAISVITNEPQALQQIATQALQHIATQALQHRAALLQVRVAQRYWRPQVAPPATGIRRARIGHSQPNPSLHYCPHRHLVLSGCQYLRQQTLEECRSTFDVGSDIQTPPQLDFVQQPPRICLLPPDLSG